MWKVNNSVSQIIGRLTNFELPLERSMNMKRIVSALLAVALMSMTLMACHTVKGAGQDIQSGGRSVEKAADSARK